MGDVPQEGDGGVSTSKRKVYEMDSNAITQRNEQLRQMMEEEGNE